MAHAPNAHAFVCSKKKRGKRFIPKEKKSMRTFMCTFSYWRVVCTHALEIRKLPPPAEKLRNNTQAHQLLRINLQHLYIYTCVRGRKNTLLDPCV